MQKYVQKICVECQCLLKRFYGKTCFIVLGLALYQVEKMYRLTGLDTNTRGMCVHSTVNTREHSRWQQHTKQQQRNTPVVPP